MALSETLTETAICNMALDELGANRIKDTVDDDTSVEAIKCRLHYEPTRDALEQLVPWRFTRGRETLTEDAETPGFEWGKQFVLPADYLATKSVYEGRFSDENIRSYSLEGNLLLTNETTVELRYIKKVTDVTKFEPLFLQVFVLQLALKLKSLAGATPKIAESIKDSLDDLMPTVMAFAEQEINTAGRLESSTWNDGRFSGRDPSRLG